MQVIGHGRAFLNEQADLADSAVMAPCGGPRASCNPKGRNGYVPPAKRWHWVGIGLGSVRPGAGYWFWPSV